MRSVFLVVTALFTAAGPVAAQTSMAFYQGSQVIADEVIVRLHNSDQPTLARLAAQMGGARLIPIGKSLGLHVLKSNSQTVAALMSALRANSDIAYVHPNHVIRVTAIPNDPLYGQLWGIQKVNAPQAWGISTGSSTAAIGVLDTGIDYTHPDLAANVWSAPAAFTVNIGGESITCPAGSHGFNAIAMNCDPLDDNSHGTHVSGTIGAAGNNSIGVAGMNWNATIVGLKFMDSTGTGSLSDALKAVEFAIQAKEAFAATLNLRVISASWGSADFAQSLLDELNNAGSHEILFVAAAGNLSANNDSAPFYPASYTAPNVIAVAATDSSDELASFSDYGFGSVHLGAPGVNVLSTVRGGGYGTYSGTSMATPHVSGAALLTLAACPTLTTGQLKNVLLSTVDPVSALAGRTITGGRLNVQKAIQSCMSLPVGSVPIGFVSGCISTVSGDHWKGEYFNNTTLSGNPAIVRDDGAEGINFNWGNQGSPGGACNFPGTLFSVRWTRSVTFNAGAYRLSTSSDDGMRLYIDGQRVVDRWFDQAANLQTVDVPLTGGAHTLVVEYYQGWGNASAAVNWQQLSGAAPPLSITSITPNVATSGTTPVITVAGAGFDATFRAYVVSGGQAQEIVAKQFIDASKVQLTPAIGGSGDPNAKLRITVGSQTAESGLSILAPAGSGCMATVTVDHWRGEYFNNTLLSGSPVMTRDDGTDVLNFNWGNQGSPSAACGLPGILFSARWTRLVSFTAGTYRFTTSSDDGMRLYLDGQKVQDRWLDQAASPKTVDMMLTGGTHTVMVEYYQGWGNDSAAVSWQQVSIVAPVSLSMNSISPNVVTSGTTPVLTVAGAGFDATFRAYIVSGGQATEIAAKQFINTSTIQVMPTISGLGDANAKLRITVGGQTVESALPILAPPATGCIAAVGVDHWKGEYFNNLTLSGSALMVRDDGTDALNFNWGNQGSPSVTCNVPGILFSVRWTRSVTFNPGTYRFTTSSDDGMRLYIDGRVVQDRWMYQGATPQTVDVPLAGGTHVVMVEYFQGGGQDSAAVSWQLL